MRIDTLRIKNFKGIAEMTISLPTQFTVLIGDNGTGKTAILDALSVAAGSYLLGIDKAYSKPRTIYPEEVRRVSFSRVERNVEQFPVVIEAQGRVHDTQINWKRELHGLSDKVTATVRDAKQIRLLAENAQKQSRESTNSQAVVLPVLSYQGTGRLWAEHKEKKEKIEFSKQGSRLEGYVDCLSERSSIKMFKSWYKTIETEARNFDDENFQRLLDTFKATITAVVDGWNDIAYSPVDDDLIGSYLKPNGERVYLPFRSLSDGNRNMVAMVADIAYRCLKLNPFLGIDAVRNTPGIVLIDEIDLHLHPKWQKRIVADLKRVFPNIQFIATTHSPFIIQSLSNEELINLEPEKDQNDTDPFRLSIEDIAEREMDVEQPNRSNKFIKMEEIAASYFDLLAQGQNSSNGEVARIKQELDIIESEFSNDPAYVALLKAERASQLTKI